MTNLNGGTNNKKRMSYLLLFMLDVHRRHDLRLFFGFFCRTSNLCCYLAADTVQEGKP